MATEYICYALDGHGYRIVLDNGTALTLPATTEDAELVAELRKFAKHHPGLVEVTTTAEYEKACNVKAEAATTTKGSSLAGLQEKLSQANAAKNGQ